MDCDYVVSAAHLATYQNLRPASGDGKLEQLVMQPKQQIAVRDGRILDISSAEDEPDRYRPRERYDLDHHLLVPGFINAHTHVGMTLLRNYAEDVSLMDWLHSLWPAETHFLPDPDYVPASLYAGLSEMIRSGTTNIVCGYFNADDYRRVFNEIQFQGTMGIGFFDHNSPHKNLTRDASYSTTRRLAELWHGDGSERLQPMVFPHSLYTCTLESVREGALLAEELDIPFHTHMNESKCELSEAQKLYGKSCFEVACENKMITKRWTLAHMCHASESDFQRLRATGASVVHCPSSNLKLASGGAPIRRYLDDGVNVALGTDSAASNNSLSMLNEIHLAALLSNLTTGQCGTLSAKDVFKMATLNGAKSMGLADRTGTIEVGKQADFVAVNIMNRFDTTPIYDDALLSTLVHSTARDNIDYVWCRGVKLLDKGQLQTIDIPKAKLLVEKVRAKIDAFRREHFLGKTKETK